MEAAEEHGWRGVAFQTYLNNKVDFKRSGDGSSWWLLDEPAYRDDFLALAYFARLHRAVVPPERRARFPFRIDLSRPQFRREYLDGLVDLCVNNAARFYPRQSLEPVRRFGEELWSYGQAPGPEHPPWECVGWLLEAFDHGATGLVPWQSVGTYENWTEASALALLLPPRPGYADQPAPTLRLLALRHAVEDTVTLTDRRERSDPRAWPDLYGARGRLAPDADPLAPRRRTSLAAVEALRTDGR